MKGANGIFLRVIAVLYGIGALLHLADLFDLRLKFSEMNGVWKAWIIYLFVFDCIAAIGLWKGRPWGIAAFLVVSISQLVGYISFQNLFGPQWALVAFHIATLCGFIFLGGFRRVFSIGVLK